MLVEVHPTVRERQKLHLQILLPLLKLDLNAHRLSNGCVCSGEEILMVGLYRLCNIGEMALLVPVFGREESQLCRIDKYFINYMVVQEKRSNIAT